VLNLQEKLGAVRGDEDCRDLASTIFEEKITTAKESLIFTVRLAKQQEELNTMNNQCRVLEKVRNELSDKLARSTSAFQRELKQKVSIARADAMDMAQAQVDEKTKLSKLVESIQEELSNEQERFARAKRDAEAEKMALGKMNEDLKSRIETLEKQVKSNDAKLGKSIEECEKKDAKLMEISSSLEEAKLVAKATKEQNDTLIEEHHSGNQKLEESLTQLISMVEIHSSKEKEDQHERQKLMDAQSAVKDALDEETKRRRRAEGKYSQLKDKYIQSKEKHDNELKRRDEDERRREEKLREEAKRRHDDERRRKERKQRSEGEKSTKRRNDGRKPMGTLEFMNSFHDTSIRSDRTSSGKHNDNYSSNRNKETSRGGHRSSGKRSGFRIVR
jgi:myosin heavy subunit